MQCLTFLQGRAPDKGVPTRAACVTRVQEMQATLEKLQEDTDKVCAKSCETESGNCGVLKAALSVLGDTNGEVDLQQGIENPIRRVPYANC